MSTKPSAIPPDELRAFFRAIETRAVELVAEVEPQDVYAGDVVYRASNGWTLVVFNDANEYDYVDAVVTADGRRADFDELEHPDRAWQPDDALAWRCLGIPGYCTFRCTGCGALLPDGIARGGPVTSPFLCGGTSCIGMQVPADGTWIGVRPPPPRGS